MAFKPQYQNKSFMQVLSLKPSDVYEDTSGDKSYTHTQTVAATTWTVIHNMGRKPSVEIVDSTGVLVSAEVLHLDNNTTQINCSPALAGVANCS